MDSGQSRFTLPLEATLQYQILRHEVCQASDLSNLKRLSLKLIDLMELQRKTTQAMLKQRYLAPTATPPRRVDLPPV